MMFYIQSIFIYMYNIYHYRSSMLWPLHVRSGFFHDRTNFYVLLLTCCSPWSYVSIIRQINWMPRSERLHNLFCPHKLEFRSDRRTNPMFTYGFDVFAPIFTMWICTFFHFIRSIFPSPIYIHLLGGDIACSLLFGKQDPLFSIHLAPLGYIESRQP